MRQPKAAIAIAVICALITGCAVTRGNAESTTPTRSMIPRPLVERELAGLLLSPEQVNAAMGATGMTVTNTQTSMSDNSATMAPQECLAIDGAAEAPVYASSDYWAERDQSLNDGDNFTHYLKQAVVSRKETVVRQAQVSVIGTSYQKSVVLREGENTPFVRTR